MFHHREALAVEVSGVAGAVPVSVVLHLPRMRRAATCRRRSTSPRKRKRETEAEKRDRETGRQRETAETEVERQRGRDTQSVCGERNVHDVSMGTARVTE